MFGASHQTFTLLKSRVSPEPGAGLSPRYSALPTRNPAVLPCSSVPSGFLSPQENPQATKKEEAEGTGDHGDPRPEGSPSPAGGGEAEPQDSPSAASQEDPESDVSDDSDQEVDIEGDKGFYSATR